MNQTIVLDYPPLFDEIDARFKVYGKEVIFSWGDRIYNPRNLTIPEQLIWHEAVHGARQGTDEQRIRDWWKRYMDDKCFRLSEEVHAHQAEYLWIRQHGNRRARRAALQQTAERLAGPLYGGLVTVAQAKSLLSFDSEGR